MDSEDDEVEMMYEVEDILSKRIKEGKTQYLIKWKGFKQKTWEPIAHLHNVADMIYKYEENNKQQNRSKKDVNYLKKTTKQPKTQQVRKKRLSKISHIESQTSNIADPESEVDNRRQEYLIQSLEEAIVEQSKQVTHEVDTNMNVIKDRPRVKITKEPLKLTKEISCQRDSANIYVDEIQKISDVERREEKWMAKVRFIGEFDDRWEERDLIRLLHPLKLLQFYQQLHLRRQRS